MSKIAFVGAGSTVFTRNLLGDVLGMPELADTTTIALMDIDAERLRTSELVGRRPSTVVDFDVPKRFGLRQTIADTLGVGGIMRGLRTIPVLLDVFRAMEAVCPDALLLQYVNPMAMLCWAVAETSPVRT